MKSNRLVAGLLAILIGLSVGIVLSSSEETHAAKSTAVEAANTEETAVG